MLRVNGGPAGSGTVVKREKPKAWKHVCITDGKPRGWTVPGYWASCPDCGEKRP